jgi:hypothetical protein
MDDGETWLSTEQASKIFGMRPEWVRDELVAGRLRGRVFVNRGRPTYRVPVSAIAEYLARYTIESRGDGTPIDLDQG